MAFKVLEVQQTPNPNALKFVLNATVSDCPLSYFSADAAVGNALAMGLFAIPGVSSLLLLGDFVTINKSPQTKWADITGKAKRVLAKA